MPLSARPAPIACANQQIPSRNPVFIDIRAKEASIIVSRKLYKKETEVIFHLCFCFFTPEKKSRQKTSAIASGNENVRVGTKSAENIDISANLMYNLS